VGEFGGTFFEISKTFIPPHAPQGDAPQFSCKKAAQARRDAGVLDALARVLSTLSITTAVKHVLFAKSVAAADHPHTNLTIRGSFEGAVLAGSQRPN
jgi:hypothetical protein